MVSLIFPAQESAAHPLQRQGVPLFMQIKNALQARLDHGLRAGELHPGGFFTTEKDICREFQVSIITAKRALDELESEGRLVRQRGRGTFIAQPRIAQNLDHFYRFSTQLLSQGLQPGCRNLSVKVIAPPPHIAHLLELGPRQKVISLFRLRLVNAEPFFLQTSYLPQARFAGLEQEDHDRYALYDLLRDKYHRAPARCQDTFEPVLLHKSAAEYLQVPVRSAGMLIERVTRASDGEIIEVSRGVVRGDRCRLTVDLS